MHSAFKITGYGKYLPPKIETSVTLAKKLKKTEKWIISRTGVEERRVSTIDVDEMGAIAAKEAIGTKEPPDVIINASGAGKFAPGKAVPLGAYAASKHAVVGFGRQLGLELSDHQILVNCVCAGIVDTPMWELIDREIADLEGVPRGSVLEKIVGDIPLGRIQKPEDVANVVAFLASNDANYMTSDTINVAGGIIPY